MHSTIIVSLEIKNSLKTDHSNNFVSICYMYRCMSEWTVDSLAYKGLAYFMHLLLLSTMALESHIQPQCSHKTTRILFLQN